jgi:outer membrane immunogenic protein
VPRKPRSRISLPQALKRNPSTDHHAPEDRSMLRPVLGGVAAVLALFGLATLAPAADIGSLKDVRGAPPPLYSISPSWSGLYVGLHGGYGWGDVDWSFKESYFAVPGDKFSDEPEGWLGGGQIGFNVQTGSLVWGLEASLSGANIESSSSSPFGADDTFSTDIHRLWTLTGRLGYAFDHWLAYVKGGYAGGRVEISAANDLADLTATATETHHGWTLGAGLEYLVTPNLTLGLEYNYLDLGQAEYRALDSEEKVFEVDNDVTAHTVMLRLNYKFGR